MWFKLAGADFSKNNLGTMSSISSSYLIDYTGLTGMSGSPSSVSYAGSSAGTSKTASVVVTVTSGYTFKQGSTITASGGKSGTVFTADKDYTGGQTFTFSMAITANTKLSGTAEATGGSSSGGNTGGGGGSTGGEEDSGSGETPAVNYLLNLDFTQKSFADYISDGTLGAITGTLSTTHTSEGDTFASSDVSYVALGKSLTFPTNFEIQLRMKTSDYNHIPGCGIPLFTTRAARPWIFLRGDYDNNSYDNSFGLQSRLVKSGGDTITIDDVTIPCNDNAFHDVILHYEGNNVWMSVDGVKSKTATSTRDSNTVTHMFGYSATYTADKVTLAYIKVIKL